MKTIFHSFVAVILCFFSSNLFAQVPCDLSTYNTAYIINLNDYPYTSPGSGITVNSAITGYNTTPNFSYTCGGNLFATSNPPLWLNSAAQVWTLTFSAPVTSFTLVANGTDNGEIFYVNAAVGTVAISNYCTTFFTATGNQISCFATTATGTIFTITNATPSTTYTITHNGTGAGSRIALLDCFVGGCSTIDTVNASICDNRSYNINNKEYTTAGIYIDTFKVGSCDSIVVTDLVILPTYNLTVEDSIYEGSVYNFLGNAYAQDGNYHHRLSSVDGCDSNIALRLKVIPVNRIFVDTTICEYDFYEFGGRKYNTQGIHSDTFVYAEYHEILVLNLNVRRKPNVSVDLFARDVNDLCIGEDIEMKAKGAERYEWYKLKQPLNELFSKNSSVNGWVYDSTTQLMLRGFDDLGCYNDFVFDLSGRSCCSVFIPNAFSPNGDGLNDEFKLIGVQPRKYFLQIFNRYGQLVFSAENIDKSWDGKGTNGLDSQSDVYFYHLTGDCYDGTKLNERGSVTLIR